MASLFPTGSANAYQRYATDLSNAIKHRDWKMGSLDFSAIGAPVIEEDVP